MEWLEVTVRTASQGVEILCAELTEAGFDSFVVEDCEEFAEKLAKRGIAVRAGLHCAPLAHKSAGTLTTGTVRASFGWNSAQEDAVRLLEEIQDIR